MKNKKLLVTAALAHAYGFNDYMGDLQPGLNGGKKIHVTMIARRNHQKILEIAGLGKKIDTGTFCIYQGYAYPKDLHAFHQFQGVTSEQPKILSKITEDAVKKDISQMGKGIGSVIESDILQMKQDLKHAIQFYNNYKTCLKK